MGKSQNLEFLVWNSIFQIGKTLHSGRCAKSSDGDLSFVSCFILKKKCRGLLSDQGNFVHLVKGHFVIDKKNDVSSGLRSLLAPIVLTSSFCLKPAHEESLSESNSGLPITGISADNKVLSVLPKSHRCEKTGSDIVIGNVAESVILLSSVLLKDVSGIWFLSWDIVPPFPG